MLAEIYNTFSSSTSKLSCPAITTPTVVPAAIPTLFNLTTNMSNIPRTPKTEYTHRDLTVYQSCINKVYNYNVGSNNIQALMTTIINTYVPLLPPNGSRYVVIKQRESLLDASHALLTGYDASYTLLVDRITQDKITFNTNQTQINTIKTNLATFDGIINTHKNDLNGKANSINSHLNTYGHRNFATNMFNDCIAAPNLDTKTSELYNNLIIIEYYRLMYKKIMDIYNNYSITSTNYDTIVNDYINYILNSNTNDLKNVLSLNATLNTTYINVKNILNSMKTNKNAYTQNLTNCQRYTDRYTTLNNAFLNCYTDTHVQQAKDQYDRDTKDVKDAKKNNKSNSTIQSKQNTRQSSLDCYNGLNLSIAHYKSPSFWNKSTNMGKNISDFYDEPSLATSIKVFSDLEWMDKKISGSKFTDRHADVLTKCTAAIKNKCNEKSIKNASDYIKQNTASSPDSTACTTKDNSNTLFNTYRDQLLSNSTNIITLIKDTMKLMGVPNDSSLLDIPNGDKFKVESTFTAFKNNTKIYIDKIKIFIPILNTNFSYVTDTYIPEITRYNNYNGTKNNTVITTYNNYSNNFTTRKNTYNQHYATFYDGMLFYLFITINLPLINEDMQQKRLYDTICANIAEANRIKGLFNTLKPLFNTSKSVYTQLISDYDRDVGSYNDNIATVINSFNICSRLQTCDRPVSNPISKNNYSYIFTRSESIPQNQLDIFSHVENSVAVNAEAIKQRLNEILTVPKINSYATKTYSDIVLNNQIISTVIVEGMENYDRTKEISSYTPNNNYFFINAEGMCNNNIYNKNPQNNLPNTVADLTNVSFYSKFITDVKRADDLSQNLMNLQNNLQIDMYYLLKYNAQIDLLKYMIVTCCVALIGSLVYHSGLFTSMFYSVYLIAVFSIGFLAIIYKYFDIFQRSKLDFNEKDYDMIKPPVITDMSGNSNSESATDLAKSPSICDIEKEMRGADNIF
jgi:hypothetical protein